MPALPADGELTPEDLLPNTGCPSRFASRSDIVLMHRIQKTKATPDVTEKVEQNTLGSLEPSRVFTWGHHSSELHGEFCPP